MSHMQDKTTVTLTCSHAGDKCALHHHCAGGMSCPRFHCCAVHALEAESTLLRYAMAQHEKSCHNHKDSNFSISRVLESAASILPSLPAAVCDL